MGSNVTPLPPFNTFGKFQPHTVSPDNELAQIDCSEQVTSLFSFEGVTKAKYDEGESRGVDTEGKLLEAGLNLQVLAGRF